MFLEIFFFFKAICILQFPDIDLFSWNSSRFCIFQPYSSKNKIGDLYMYFLFYISTLTSGFSKIKHEKNDILFRYDIG